MSTQISKTIATVIACGLSCYLAASPLGVAHAASDPAATTVEVSQGAESVHQSLFGMNPDAGWLEIDGFAGVPGTYHGSMSDDNFAATIVSAEPIAIDGADGVFLVEATLSSSMGSAVTSALVVSDGMGTAGAALIPIPAITTLLLQTAPPAGPGGGGGAGPAGPGLGTQSNCNLIVGASCEAVRDRAICMAANAHNTSVAIAINTWLASMNAALTAYTNCITGGWWPEELAQDAACLAAYQMATRAAALALRASVQAAWATYQASVQAAWTAYHACPGRTGNVPPAFPIDSVPPFIDRRSQLLIPALW